MGQQSEGKSFSLNHLLDTSFAGSAMRTTGMGLWFLPPSLCRADRRVSEGVWMSVTPTDDTLIVALDFEGQFLCSILITTNIPATL